MKRKELLWPVIIMAVLIAAMEIRPTKNNAMVGSSIVVVQPLTKKEAKLATFFIKHGAENPVKLAQVVATKKRPRLAAAQAIIESNGRNVRGKAGEKGIWQIIEREHGVVPDDIEGQADKWEQVFEDYLACSKGRLKEALCRYNSGRPDRSEQYALKVLSIIREVGI